MIMNTKKNTSAAVVEMVLSASIQIAPTAMIAQNAACSLSMLASVLA